MRGDDATPGTSTRVHTTRLIEFFPIKYNVFAIAASISHTIHLAADSHEMYFMFYYTITRAAIVVGGIVVIAASAATVQTKETM